MGVKLPFNLGDKIVEKVTKHDDVYEDDQQALALTVDWTPEEEAKAKRK